MRTYVASIDLASSASSRRSRARKVRPYESYRRRNLTPLHLPSQVVDYSMLLCFALFSRGLCGKAFVGSMLQATSFGKIATTPMLNKPFFCFKLSSAGIELTIFFVLTTAYTLNVLTTISSKYNSEETNIALDG